MTRLRIASMLLAAVACGGKPTQTTPTPGGSVLTAMDPDLSPLAKAAARALEPASDGKVRFAGVFVGGRELKALSDTVARSIGATRVGMPDGRVPYTIGRVGSGEGTASRRDATYALSFFRVDGDTAYVGADARSIAEADGAICIILSRARSGWLIRQTSVSLNPRNCGAKP